MGPQYKYDVTNDVIDDESRAELYSSMGLDPNEFAASEIRSQNVCQEWDSTPRLENQTAT